MLMEDEVMRLRMNPHLTEVRSYVVEIKNVWRIVMKPLGLYVTLSS
jgi:hypothetical protein